MSFIMSPKTMDTSTPSSAPNRYCADLGIALPHLEDIRPTKELSLFMWTVLVLIEKGQAMTPEEIADRLTVLGILDADEDGVDLLRRAWHGLEPVYRTAQGLYGLNTRAWLIGPILRDAGLKKPLVRAETTVKVSTLDDTVPLTIDEVDAALRDRVSVSLSPLRQVAAVLDAKGPVMAMIDVDAILAGLLPRQRQPATVSLAHTNTNLVTVDANGMITLDRTVPEVIPMRRAVRKVAQPVLARRARHAAWEVEHAEREQVRAQESKIEEAGAAKLRRAVVRVVPEPDDIAAAAVLDMNTRTIRTFVGEALEELGQTLRQYDVLVGIQIRDTLEALGLDPDSFKIADLKPPKKSRQLNRSGRKLTITPELLISSTTLISKPLADPAKVAAYLADQEDGLLAKRLASDAKALFAFYQYGILHNHVRLRWGFLDETVGVGWAEPGDLHVSQVLARAVGHEVDIVHGAAPGWESPWARAHRVRVTRVDPTSVVYELGGRCFDLEFDRIQAIRVVVVDE